MIAVGKRHIQGIECYLVEDFIESQVEEDCNVFSRYQGHSIFCSAVELARIKSQVDIPLYGIWQVLVESGVLDGLDRSKKYVLYHNAQKTAGQVLHFLDDDKIVTQSLLVAGTDDCVPIEVADDSLVLPLEPILTLSERMQKRRVEKHHSLLQMVAMVGIGLLALAFSHYYFSATHAAAENTLAELKARNAELKSALADSDSASSAAKDYAKLMRPILHLNKMGAVLEVKSIVFDNPPYQIQFPTRIYPAMVFAPHRIVKVEYRNDGGADVYWK